MREDVVMVMIEHSGYGRGGGFKPCPVEMGKEYEVDITETSRQGDGIARIQGFIILEFKGVIHLEFLVEELIRIKEEMMNKAELFSRFFAVKQFQPNQY